MGKWYLSHMGLRDQRVTTKVQTSLRIHADMRDFVIFFWKVSYLNLLS